MVHELLGNISKITFVLGTIFIFTKIQNKKTGDKLESFHNRFKNILYQLHTNGTKIGIIAGFYHGLTIEAKALIYVNTGWILGIIMLVLLLTGAFLSIKQKSKPMTPKDDETYKTIRSIKWIFTILLYPAIGIHYLLPG